MGNFSRSEAIKRLAGQNTPYTAFCQLCGKLLTYSGWASVCYGRRGNFGRICDDCLEFCSSRVRRKHKLDYFWRLKYAESVARDRRYSYCEACGVKVNWKEKRTFVRREWKTLLSKLGWAETMRIKRNYYFRKYFLCELCFQRIKKGRHNPKSYISYRAKKRYLENVSDDELKALEINNVVTKCTINQWMRRVPEAQEEKDWKKIVAPHIKRLGKLHDTDYIKKLAKINKKLS